MSKVSGLLELVCVAERSVGLCVRLGPGRPEDVLKDGLRIVENTSQFSSRNEMGGFSWRLISSCFIMCVDVAPYCVRCVDGAIQLFVDGVFNGISRISVGRSRFIVAIVKRAYIVRIRHP